MLSRRLLATLLICSAPAAAETLAFRNVTVVPMDREAILPGQTVLIREGRIAELGPARRVRIPQGTVVIDGRGRYLMPGLAEMHAHVPALDHPQLQVTLDLFLANGVTTLRGVLGDPSHLELRGELASGKRSGPRLHAGGPSLNGNSVQDAGQAAAQVEAQKRAGYDLLKIHPGLDVARFDAILDTAHRLSIPVVGHVPEAVGLEHALARRMDCIEHLDDYVRALVPAGKSERTASPGFFGLNAALAADRERIPELVHLTRQAGAWITPTETLMVSLLGEDSEASLLARGELAYVPEATRSQWLQQRRQLRSAPGYSEAAARRFLELRGELLVALDAGESHVLLGSDAPQIFNVPGFSTHRELALMVRAGLSPFRALRTGTVNVARNLGTHAHRGTIAVGMDADVVLLTANPLADIGNARTIVGVMVAGRWYDRADLDTRLAAARPVSHTAP